MCDITLYIRILFLGKNGQSLSLVIPRASLARKKMKLADTSLNTLVDPNDPRRAVHDYDSVIISSGLKF